jgi:hypothetical protein
MREFCNEIFNDDKSRRSRSFTSPQPSVVPEGVPHGGLVTEKMLENSLPRRTSKNLMVLLPFHRFGIRCLEEPDGSSRISFPRNSVPRSSFKLLDLMVLMNLPILLEALMRGTLAFTHYFFLIFLIRVWRYLFIPHD